MHGVWVWCPMRGQAALTEPLCALQWNCACGAACVTMATLLNSSRLGVPISTPSRRCGFITGRVQPGASSGVMFAALRASETCSTSASS
jgi:hypothetical protein